MKRAIAAILSIAVVGGAIPAAVGSFDNTNYAVTAYAEDREVDLAAIRSDYVAQDGDILTGTLRANVKLSIEDGASVTLKDAVIKGTSDIYFSTYRWAGITCKGDAEILLKGNNNVECFSADHPGIYIPCSKTLTIGGKGSLSANGAAGIGGGDGMACGNIVINNGDIYAKSCSNGAGIGTGSNTEAEYPYEIIINGGNVKAESADYGAGIGNGSGNYDTYGSVTINGGTVIAKSLSEGAGIGSGFGSNFGDITINGGTVIANGGADSYAFGTAGAGIGSGCSGSAGDITIKGGSVTAKGGDGGYRGSIGAAGIGSSTCGNITISDTVRKVVAEKGNDSYHTIYAGKKLTIGGVEYSDIQTSPYTYEGVSQPLENGIYEQKATKNGRNYTRFVFVKPISETAGKSKAVFNASLNGVKKEFETSTYYTGVTSNGINYTPASEDSVMFIVTVSSTGSLEGLTCELELK